MTKTQEQIGNSNDTICNYAGNKAVNWDNNKNDGDNQSENSEDDKACYNGNANCEASNDDPGNEDENKHYHDDIAARWLLPHFPSLVCSRLLLQLPMQ